jgi:hypothetical protein
MLDFVLGPELWSLGANGRRNAQTHVFVTRPELASGRRRPISEATGAFLAARCAAQLEGSLP